MGTTQLIGIDDYSWPRRLGTPAKLSATIVLLAYMKGRGPNHRVKLDNLTLGDYEEHDLVVAAHLLAKKGLLIRLKVGKERGWYALP